MKVKLALPLGASFLERKLGGNKRCIISVCRTHRKQTQGVLGPEGGTWGVCQEAVLVLLTQGPMGGCKGCDLASWKGAVSSGHWVAVVGVSGLSHMELASGPGCSHLSSSRADPEASWCLSLRGVRVGPWSASLVGQASAVLMVTLALWFFQGGIARASGTAHRPPSPTRNHQQHRGCLLFG